MNQPTNTTPKGASDGLAAAVQTLVNLELLHPDDEAALAAAREMVDRAAGSLAVQLDALNDEAARCETMIQQATHVLDRAKHRKVIALRLTEAALRNSGAERLTSPETGTKFDLVGKPGRIECKDITKVDPDFIRAKLTVTGSEEHVEAVLEMLESKNGRQMFPSIVPGALTVEPDKAGAKTRMKADRDPDTGKDGDPPAGFVWVEGGKRLRITEAR